MHGIGVKAVILLAIVTVLGLGGCQARPGDLELVNVSYDPTRELYQDINQAFVAKYEKDTGLKLRITQSHGGSGSQARAVIDGLQADVVTLALAGDIEAIEKRGLIHADWQARLPHNSAPYTSTIVFVVRKGNPKGIKDWPDLVRAGVSVITPNPKTSGGARWNFLAAWGFITVHQHQSEAAAKEFVQKLYGNVAKLDTGARGSTDTFLRRKLGDVLIAWENEALLAQKESGNESIEIVYPSASVLAEPPVAVVDKYADARGTRAAAEAYLQFLYTDEAQDIVGKNGYRPSNPAFQQKYVERLPPLKLYSIKEVAGSWSEAQAKLFNDGGVFDQIYQAKSGK
jgi:sulfate transport system substrate-binding protein